MARIQTYQSQIDPGPGTGSVRLDPDVAAAVPGTIGRLGRGVNDASENLAQAEARVRISQEHQAATEGTRQLAQLRLDWTRRALQMEQEAPAGAPDFTDRFEAAFDADIAARAKAMPDSVRAYLEPRLADFKSQLVSGAMVFEAKSRVAKRRTDLGAIADLGANTVRGDAAQFAPAWGDFKSALDASGLPEQERAALALDARDRFARSLIEGMAERDPAAALAELESGRFDSWLSPETRQTLAGTVRAGLDREERARKEELAEARADLSLRFADAVASVRFTGGQNLVTEKEIRGAYADAPEHATRMIRSLRAEQGTYAATQRLALATPAEANAILDRAKPRGAGAAQAAEGYAHLVAAYNRRQGAIAQDPAAYVLSNSPALQARLTDAGDDAAKLRGYFARQDELQAQIGVPAHARRLLPADEAKARVARLTGGGPEQAADMMQGMAQAYGPSYWPRIYGELVAAKLPDSYIALATTDDPAARRSLATAMKTGEQGLKAALPKGDAKTVDEEVAAQLGDFRSTVAAAPDGVTVGNRYAGAARLLAYHYVTQGMRPSEAASRAADEVVNGRYDFALGDGYNARAPRGLGADVEAAADATMQALKPGDLGDPGGGMKGMTPEQRQAAYLRSVRRGTWITNETDDGWVLLDELGQPVLRADGSPVDLAFKDVTPGAAAPAATPAGPSMIAP